MSLYCEGKNCGMKENCLRYVKLQELKKEFADIEEKGCENGVWMTNVRECNTNIEYFYKPIKKNTKI